MRNSCIGYASLIIIFFVCSCKIESLTLSNEPLLRKTVTNSWDTISILEFGYDSAGILVKLTESNNNNHSLAYTLSREPGSNVGELHRWYQMPDGTEYNTDYTLEYNGDKIIKKCAGGICNTYGYDNRGRLIVDSVVNANTNFCYSYNEYIYDDNDNVIARRWWIDSAGAFVVDEYFTATYNNEESPYYKNGILLRIVDNIGQEMFLSRHNRSSLESMITGETTHFSYSYTGPLLTRMTGTYLMLGAEYSYITDFYYY